MTSIILAQKLVSLNLSESEFAKIKCLRANIKEQQRQIIDSLKKVIDEQKSHKTCRLCLKPGRKRIFDRHKDVDFVFNIKFILGIEVSETDGKPQYICSLCENTLREAERLKQTAVITQWRLQQELDMVTNIEIAHTAKKSVPRSCFVEREAKILRKWTCKKCKRPFLDEKELIVHEKQPTCQSSRFCICEMCGLKLKTISLLKRHRLVHTGERPYPCTACPYRGSTKHALQSHVRVHGSDPAHVCDECGVAYANAGALLRHRRCHGPPTMYCTMCDARFRFKSSLQHHIISKHKAARPHKCSTCGKGFVSRKMLANHERRMHNRIDLVQSEIMHVQSEITPMQSEITPVQSEITPVLSETCTMQLDR